MTNPTDPATWHKTGAQPDVNRDHTIQVYRDAKVCTCGHRNISHGYGHPDGPTWPDGSQIGRGGCGIDRDTRNAATGYLGDRCPCTQFTAAGAGA